MGCTAGYWTMQHRRLVTHDKTVGNDSVPIQLAQCRLSGQAISNAKKLICFSYKIHQSNFIEPLEKFELPRMLTAV